MKKMKVKEIKSGVKVIREIKRESEGDREIKELTDGEVPANEFEVENATIGVANFQLNRGGGNTRVIESVSGRPIDQSPRGEESSELAGVSLYDVGRSMSGEAGQPTYKLAEAVEEERLRSVNVGRDFAMGQSPSDYPEANRIEGSLRQEDEKKYTAGMESPGGRGKTKRYEWEV